MKKLLQMKFMLLLCALIVGSGTMWAEDEVYYTLDGTITTGGNSNYAQDGGGLTQNSISWSVTGNTTINPWRIGGKKLSSVDRAAYSQTAMGSAITKVELEIGDITLSAVNSIKFIVASDADFGTILDEQTISTVTANQTYTFVPTSGSEWTTGAYYKFVFNVTAGNSNSYIQLKSAKFYKAGATFSPLDHITLSGDNYPTTFYVGDTFSHEGMTVTATYVNETTKDVTTGATFSGYDMSTAGVQTVTVSYTQGEGDNAITKSATYNITVKGLSSVRLDGTYPVSFTEGDAFSHEGMTVYAVYTDGTNESEEDVTSDAVFSEPDMTIVGNQNVTVSYTKNNVTKSTEYEITINALPTHNVTWSVNGTVTEPVSYKEGAAIEFPVNPADIEGKSFVGWATDAIVGTTETAPEFVTSATMGNENITYYAVFAEKTETTGDMTKAYGFETESDSDWTIDGPARTEGEANTGNYSGKINTNNTYVTFNNKVKVKEFSFAFKKTSTNNNYNVYIETSTDNTSWTAAATYPMSDFGNGTYTTKNKTFDGNTEMYVRFHCSNTTAVRYVDDVTIKYDGTTISYSGYCTTVALAAPTFSPAPGSYTSAQSVTISAADGATIYYTTDGSTPTTESTQYSGAITVDESMTIKAIAVKDSEISNVATAEYVINLTPSIAFDGEQNPANVTYTAGETNIHYVASNVADLPTIVICDSEGNQASYDWFSAVVTNDAYVHVTWQANTDTKNSRTAYFKLTSGATESEIFEFTQAKYVPDYATLPFEFDGGLNDIESTSGLTQNGLGTDYSSKPKLKFDTTGDYLVLKIDEAPGKLTFDIEGHSFSGGTFKVQTSADGETFTDLASYTDLGNTKRSEEFDDLADNVRYIKWVYTEKVSGNVGLGNINLAKLSTDPVIKLAETSVEVDAKQHDGTIALTYKNLQIDSMDDFDVQFYSDEQGTVTADAPEWVEALVAAQAPNVGPGYVLSYVINANDGAARTAYLRVYANDGVNSVASDVVTITQAKFVKTTTYTLAHAITPGKHYVIASGNVGTVYVMGEQKSTNRDVVYGAEVNFSEVLSVTEDIAADVREFIISKDGNYYTIFDFDENESGYLYASSTSDNHLKTQATNNANGQWTITIDEEGVATLKANMTGHNWMRFNKNSEVFSCYGENSNQQDIYLFEKDNDEGSLVIPIAAACTDGTKCYATFSSTKPVVVPENLTVSEIGINTDGTMNVVNYDAGAVVPANTGVMVSAAAGDRSYVANVSTEVGNNVLNGDNRLRPTGDNGLAATEMNSAEPETCKFYRLTMHGAAENNPGKIGFWWGADGGDSFAIAANKAYLAVPASVAGARNGFAFGDDATGINNVNINLNDNDNCYDLQGRKVNKPGKGLYIVNGKKVVIK